MNELTQLIRKLAQELSTTSNHLWDILMTQARLEVYAGIFWITLAVALTVFLIWYFKWIKRNILKLTNEGAETVYLSILVVLIFIDVAIIVKGILSIFTIINYILNPEYLAIQKILKSLH